jgi:hypothetical protein
MEHLPLSIRRIVETIGTTPNDVVAWRPYPDGPQSRAYHSPADVVGYGGAAGGGKTDLIVGLAATSHRQSIIFRREYPQLRAIIERLREVVDGGGKWNGQDKIYRLDSGRTIELGAVQRLDDVSKYRGRPHDLIAFDEAAEFAESQVRFLMGWLRSTIANQRCRVVLTFNPPTSTDGQWIVQYFAPWLDQTHPHPALPGDLRWFAMIDGEEVERESGDAFEHAGETIKPLSRTFYPAKLSDNPALAKTSYRATLQALPEPLRSQLLFGDFAAGVKEDAFQVIPTAWIRAAIERWKARIPATDGPCIAGVDVAHGGRDVTVLALRHGDWIAPLRRWDGKETPTGNAAAQRIAEAIPHHDKTVLNVDAIGYGASAAERLGEDPPQGFGLRAKAVNVGAASRYTDRSGRFRMLNIRAECYWRLREALDPDHEPTLALPDDPRLIADLTAPRYEVTTTGIKIEAKDAITARLKRSPDDGDAVALSMLQPRTIEIV